MAAAGAAAKEAHRPRRGARTPLRARPPARLPGAREARILAGRRAVGCDRCMGNATITTVRVARGLSYLVYAFVLIALIILVLGFFLLLFGANPDAPFAEWVYRSLARVMAPFRGIFEPVKLNGDSVLDTSVLFAMIVYGMVGIALSALIHWLTQKQLELRRKQALVAASTPEERTPVAV